jgi:O-antigen/teichoic acid export membrane protein
MLKKIFYSFSVYTLTTVLCALLSLLILPILTTHLSQRDYGLTALFSTFVMILTPILGFTSGSYFWLAFFKKEPRVYLNKLFSTYFWLICGMSLVIIILLIIFFPLLKNLSVFNLLFILLIPATGFISLISCETGNYFINNKKPVNYLIYSVLITLIELGLSYYLVVYVLKCWEGRIVAWFISLFIQFLFTVWLFGFKEKYIQFTFSKSLLFKLLLFGYPLIFHQLGKFIINQSDRLFITKMISLDEAGIYSIGYQVGAMLLLPIAAFANFYGPFVYERLSDINPQKKIEIVKVSYIFAGVILFCFLALLIISPLFFELLIDKKFFAGKIYVFWVALAYVFWGLYMMFSTVIFYKEKTKFLGWLAVLNVTLNALFNYCLILKFGAIGAAYATTISFFIVCVITVLYSNKLYPMPWSFFMKKNNIKKITN